jgi:hypothetical protein
MSDNTLLVIINTRTGGDKRNMKHKPPVDGRCQQCYVADQLRLTEIDVCRQLHQPLLDETRWSH